MPRIDRGVGLQRTSRLPLLIFVILVLRLLDRSLVRHREYLLFDAVAQVLRGHLLQVPKYLILLIYELQRHFLIFLFILGAFKGFPYLLEPRVSISGHLLGHLHDYLLTVICADDRCLQVEQ